MQLWEWLATGVRIPLDWVPPLLSLSDDYYLAWLLNASGFAYVPFVQIEPIVVDDGVSWQTVQDRLIETIVAHVRDKLRDELQSQLRGVPAVWVEPLRQTCEAIQALVCDLEADRDARDTALARHLTQLQVALRALQHADISQVDVRRIVHYTLFCRPPSRATRLPSHMSRWHDHYGTVTFDALAESLLCGELRTQTPVYGKNGTAITRQEALVKLLKKGITQRAKILARAWGETRDKPVTMGPLVLVRGVTLPPNHTSLQRFATRMQYLGYQPPDTHSLFMPTHAAFANHLHIKQHSWHTHDRGATDPSIVSVTVSVRTANNYLGGTNYVKQGHGKPGLLHVGEAANGIPVGPYVVQNATPNETYEFAMPAFFPQYHIVVGPPPASDAGTSIFHQNGPVLVHGFVEPPVPGTRFAGLLPEQKQIIMAALTATNTGTPQLLNLDGAVHPMTLQTACWEPTPQEDYAATMAGRLLAEALDLAPFEARARRLRDEQTYDVIEMEEGLALQHREPRGAAA